MEQKTKNKITAVIIIGFLAACTLSFVTGINEKSHLQKQIEYIISKNERLKEHLTLEVFDSIGYVDTKTSLESLKILDDRFETFFKKAKEMGYTKEATLQYLKDRFSVELSKY